MPERSTRHDGLVADDTAGVQDQIQSRLVDAQVFLEQIVEQVLADVLPERLVVERCRQAPERPP
jgi:hypothetical protein